MGRGKKQHFIYKIHFLCGYPTGRYYLGKHTGYIDDTYAGSGNFCFAYYKKYGKIKGETYIREIVEINPSKKINEDREEVVIGDLWKTDPLCMNQRSGGKGGAWINHPVSETTRQKIGKVHNKAILQYNHKGELIKEWDSATQAANAYKFSSNDIGRCCLKHIDIYKGFIWRFKSEPLLETEIAELKKSEIVKINLNGDVIETYSSAKHAANVNNTTIKSILDCCNLKRTRVKDFIYRFQTFVGNNSNIVLPPVKGRKIKINCYDRDGNFIKTYDDIWKAAKEFTDNVETGYKNIRACCRKKYNTAYGHVWRYTADDVEKVTDVRPKYSPIKKSVIQTDLNDNFIKKYNSVSDAISELGGRASASAIYECCTGKRNQAYKYKWKYVEE